MIFIPIFIAGQLQQFLKLSLIKVISIILFKRITHYSIAKVEIKRLLPSYTKALD